MKPAGTLTHVVTIEQPTETRSAIGSVSTSWASFATKYASITPKSGGESYRQPMISVEYDDLIEMHGHLALTEKMRVTHADGRKWDIAAIETSDGKAPANSEWLTLACKRGQRQGS